MLNCQNKISDVLGEKSEVFIFTLNKEAQFLGRQDFWG